MARSVARWIVGLATVAVVLSALPLVANSQSGVSRVDPALLAAAKADPNGLFPVIVRGARQPGTAPSTRATTPAARDSEASERVQKAQETLSAAKAEGERRTLGIVGGAAASLRGAQIVALSRSAAVDRIVRDQSFSISWTAESAGEAANEPGIVATNAPAAWEELGVSGRGVTVAVIDSGVADHPDLAGRVVARVDLTGEGSTGDPGGHGTHVAGLIAGDGTASGGRWTGTAPQANIASVRVIDANGHAKLSWIFSGLQWVLANRSTYNIRVANLSFGATAMSGYQQDLLASAAELLYFAGITVVASAGNVGSAPSTITTPGDDPFLITVGATDDHGTAGLADDTVADWSSRGPTAYDAIAKPDLVAPGRRMIAARAAGSTIDTLFPDRRVVAPGATVPSYLRLSGTSMAAPVVAGIAALFLERNPGATPLAVKQQLVRTARPLAGAGVSDQGAGVIDAYAAVRSPQQPVAYTPYAPSTAFAELVRQKLYGQPLVWRDLNFHGGVDSRGLRWQDITWDDITWDAITWADITWEAFRWQDVTWQDITWEDITWETGTAPADAGGGWVLID